MVLNFVVRGVVPVILHPWLVLLFVVVFLVNIPSILLVSFRIAAALVPTLSILISGLTKLATLVVTIIFLGSCGLSDALVDARFDIERIVIRVRQI